MLRVILPIAAVAVVAIVILIVWLWWGHGRRASPGEQSIDEAEQQAIQLLLAGETWKAEQLLSQLVDDVSREHGPRSRLAGKARFAQATLLLVMEDYPRAAAALRSACDIDLADHDSRKDRLTYQMNLGDVLSRMGKHDEAEEVLRQSLEERRAFYGDAHSGYAYGLESLAEVVLRRGRADEALALADQAVRIDMANGNPHVAQGVAVKALCLKGRDKSVDCLPDWERLDGAARSAVIEAMNARADSFDPGLMLAAYLDLRARLERSPSGDGGHLVNVLIAITNTARQSGDHAARIDGFRRVIELLGPEHEQCPDAWMGLALAYTDAGRPDKADESYEQSVAAAERLRAPAQVSQALRNYAIHLAETKRLDQAHQTHRRAVETARQSQDQEMLGRALCAYGVFLQHQSSFAEAVPLLDESVRLLPASHPDAFCAQTHVKAARNKEACGCEEYRPEVMAELMRTLVLERAPRGLVKDVRVNLQNAESPISVEATRKLTDEEARQLHDAVQNALGELRRRQAAVGYGR